MILDELKTLLKSALAELDLDQNAAFIEQTPHLGHGDYFSNVALRLAKAQKANPVKLAEMIVENMSSKAPKVIAQITVEAPGFINFHLDFTYLAEGMVKVIDKKNIIAEPRVGLTPTVVIEYSAPNIAKQMGVGHLRSTIIGQALANMYKALGYTVVATNHLGDWGTQFGKLIVAFKLWGDRQKLDHDPINHLQDLYVKFSNEAKENPDLEDQARAEFAKLELGDQENLALWQEFRQVSLEEFMKMYKRLDTRIEYHMGESDYKDQNDTVYDLLTKAGLVYTQNGALILDVGDRAIPTTVLRKSDGSSVYLTRDIAQIIYRVKRWNPAKIIIVAGQEQSLHFRQLFAVASRLGFAESCDFVHVGFGLVMLEGKRMRTRAGHTLFLKDVLDEAVKRSRKIIDQKSRAISQTDREKIAELVGIGSVKYNDLSQNRMTNIAFDWDKMLSLEGNSAPYLMYTLARCRSVLAKAGQTSSAVDLPRLEESEKTLLRMFHRYQSAVTSAAQTFEPHIIAWYLYELAKVFNSYYASVPILDSEATEKTFRIQITRATATVLAEGLELLGIAYPERM